MAAHREQLDRGAPPGGGLVVESEEVGAGRLRVEVDEQGPKASGGEDGRQVHGGRRLAVAALVVGNGKELPACPAETTLAIIQSKWQALVLRSLLLNGTMRFKELQRSIEKISQKALTDNLRALEGYSIVHREVFAEVPPRMEYSLTQTGQSLRTVIDAIWAWGEEHKERLRLQDK